MNPAQYRIEVLYFASDVEQHLNEELARGFALENITNGVLVAPDNTLPEILVVTGRTNRTDIAGYHVKLLEHRRTDRYEAHLNSEAEQGYALEHFSLVTLTDQGKQSPAILIVTALRNA